jgi:hypothetical protein
MRAALAALALVALLPAPAFAQKTDHVPQYREADKEKTQQEKAADKAAQDAYKRSLGNIPDKGPSDPWGTVRSSDTPKPAATATKTAKSKSKTAGADTKQ